MTLNSEIVSSESESLILVDENDKPIGEMTKGDAHDGGGVLHRAFSVLLFNDKGEMLLQQRAAEKRLWPLYWSNSCCSHPRVGETMEFATSRRLKQELGINCKGLNLLYKFQYEASFGEVGSENELCYVYIGETDENISVNPTEIADWRFISIPDFEKELAQSPERFTPWFKMEWERIKKDHAEELRALGVAL